MLPARVSNPGRLTYESGAPPIALRSPAPKLRFHCKYYKKKNAYRSECPEIIGKNLLRYLKFFFLFLIYFFLCWVDFPSKILNRYLNR